MTRMKRNAVLAAAVLAFGGTATAAKAQGSTAAQANATDPQVAQRLSEVQTRAQNMVQLAQLAQQKAQSPAAKNLANKVATDYQKILNELQALAQKRNLTLGSSPAQAEMQKGQEGLMATLNSKTGADFDKTYVDSQVNGFKVFESAMKDLRNQTPGKDAEIKKWLDDSENVTEASLNQARQAKKQVATTK